VEAPARTVIGVGSRLGGFGRRLFLGAAAAKQALETVAERLRSRRRRREAQADRDCGHGANGAPDHRFVSHGCPLIVPFNVSPGALIARQWRRTQGRQSASRFAFLFGHDPYGNRLHALR
jgi:hypothetical protein